METKKNNRGLIWLIVILIVLVLGLVGYIVYDKVISKENTEDNGTSENIKDIAVSYCEKNIDYIYSKIVEKEKQSFTAKYFPDDFEFTQKEDIKCNLSEFEELYLYTEYNLTQFIFDLTMEEVEEGFNVDFGGTDYQLAAFVWAKKLVSEDLDKYEQNHPDLNLGTYPDENYYDGDTYILEISEYKLGSQLPSRHCYDYEINFKTKTFKKINIDVE